MSTKQINLTDDQISQISKDTSLFYIKYFCGKMSQFFRAKMSDVRVCPDKKGSIEIDCECGITHKIQTK